MLCLKQHGKTLYVRNIMRWTYTVNTAIMCGFLPTSHVSFEREIVLHLTTNEREELITALYWLHQSHHVAQHMIMYRSTPACQRLVTHLSRLSDRRQFETCCVKRYWHFDDTSGLSNIGNLIVNPYVWNVHRLLTVGLHYVSSFL